jgi:predicted ATP-grasp superfamily ATP-dependent carboligase
MSTGALAAFLDPHEFCRVTSELTIVGASVRAAAQSAARAGFAVRSGDLFADVDLCRTCPATRVVDYPRGLASVVAGNQAGGWMYTGGLENEPELIAQMASRRRLWGNGERVLRMVRQPWNVMRALRASGLLSPEVAQCHDKIPCDGSWLRKRLRSAGGTDVSPWHGHHQEPEHGEGSHYYQQFIEGNPCSAVYVAARGDAVLLAITSQLIGAPWAGAAGFCYAGSLGPLEAPPHVSRAFAAIGQVLASTFDLVGLFGVDAIVNSRGVWPIEVNPRYTASCELVDWALGVSVVGWHVAACHDGRLPQRLPPPGRTCGKAIVFASQRLVIPMGWQAEAIDAWPALADIPASGTVIEAGWPVATVLAVGDGERQVLAKLQRQAAELRVAIGDQSAR